MRRILIFASRASRLAAVAAILVAGCTFDRRESPAAPGLPADAPAAAGAPPTATASPAAGGSAGTSVVFQGAPAPQASPAGAPPRQPAPSAAGQAAPAGRNVAVEVYRQNGASVVNITSVGLASTGLGQSQRTGGVGSGFIFDGEGRIITNNHVVESADQLNVTFQDETTVPAELIGRDPDNDLAVIRVDPNGTDDAGRPIRDRLKPVRLGDSAQVTIGEDVVAIGSPLGLQQTVTAGIVSALREPGEGAAGGQIDLLGGAVQTDASINPGNSGGPLFNAAGEVIGVNTAILSQSGGNIGIGFAIPINVAKRVAPELIQRGCYRHPLVGISSLPLSQVGQAVKRQLGIPANQKGLLVQESSAGAAQAGIRAGNRTVNVTGGQLRVGGDIIVAIDGHDVTSGGDLRGYIENNKRPGDTVTLTYLRDGQRRQANVTLSERPTEQACR